MKPAAEIAATVLRRPQITRPGVLFKDGEPAPFVPLDREAELVPLATGALQAELAREEAAAAKLSADAVRNIASDLERKLAAQRGATRLLARRLLIVAVELDGYRETVRELMRRRSELETRTEEARGVASAAIQDVQNADRIIGALVRRNGTV